MAALSEDKDEELTKDLESINIILHGGNSAELLSTVEKADDQSTEKLKQCLQKNYEAQAGLQKQLDKLEVAIASNKQKLDTVTAPRRTCRKLLQKLSMATFRRGKYFRDHLGFSPPICHEGAGSYAEMDRIHTESPWTRQSETRLVEGVRFQLIEGRTRPLLRQLETHDVSEDDPSEARLKELVLAKVEAVKALSDEELYSDNTVEEVNWSSLSYEMFGHKRSGNDCRIHWTNHSCPSINKKVWSPQENKNLSKIARKHQERDWAEIARELGTGRTAFACLGQYQTVQNLGKGGGRWSKDEDKKIKSAVKLYGQNWVKVAHYVGGGRSSNNCYYRWTMSLCPDIKKGKWSKAEDVKLIEGVGVYGKKAWSKVCQFVPGRSQSQCRERYLNVLNSDLKKGPFSKDEDRVLLEACQPYEGSNACIPWSKIAKSSLPQRTDAMCSMRWKQLKSDDEVFQQFTNQALKRYSHLIKNVTTLPDTTDLPEVVKEKVKKFKYRYTTRDKRKSSIINSDSYPSPDRIISWDNSDLQVPPSYNFRRYSAALKNGSSTMFSSQPLHNSRNEEGQSSTSCPTNDQAIDGTVQNILSNLRGGTTSANVGAPLNGGEQSGSQSTPESIIDLTQDDDDDNTSSNVTAGNHTVAMGTTNAMDTNVVVNIVKPQHGPASGDHAPLTSDPVLKPLPRSFHIPPAEVATRTETRSIPHNVESHVNTEQYTRNSDTTPLMINDTVSCDLPNGSNPRTPTDIGTRDGNGKIVCLPSIGGTKSDSTNTIKGEENFPVGLRFVLRPIISESHETTAAGNTESGSVPNNVESNRNTTPLDTVSRDLHNAHTPRRKGNFPVGPCFVLRPLISESHETTAARNTESGSVPNNVESNRNTAPLDTVSRDLHNAHIPRREGNFPVGPRFVLRPLISEQSLETTAASNAGDGGTEESNNSLDDDELPDQKKLNAVTMVTTTSSSIFSVNEPLADTNILPSGTTDSIVSNIPVISNSAGRGNSTEIKRVLAAEFLRFTPRTETDERLELEKFVFEMAGFDLPVQIATEKDVLMEADAHMIVYEPNHICYSKLPRPYRRRNTGPIITPLNNDDLISRHFALSQVPIPPVKKSANIINSAIVGDYHYRLQVYATYDILIHDTYCPTQKYQTPEKPQKRPTATGQSTTGGDRKRKNAEKPKSPQSKRAKRTYVRKKGVASKTVEEVAQSIDSSMVDTATRAPAKSRQRTRKLAPKRGASKTATECGLIDPPSIEQFSNALFRKTVQKKPVLKKLSFRKRKRPPDNSNTSEQSAAHPSTSTAMDFTTIPSDAGTTPSDIERREHSNRKQKPSESVEDGNETATIDVGVSPSETVKRRKTVKFF